MKYNSQTLEQEAVLQTARQICAAVRTAPKTRGIDHLETCVLTGEDLETLASQMETLGRDYDYAFFLQKRPCQPSRRARRHGILPARAE